MDRSGRRACLGGGLFFSATEGSRKHRAGEVTFPNYVARDDSCSCAPLRKNCMMGSTFQKPRIQEEEHFGLQ